MMDPDFILKTISKILAGAKVPPWLVRCMCPGRDASQQDPSTRLLYHFTTKRVSRLARRDWREISHLSFSVSFLHIQRPCSSLLLLSPSCTPPRSLYRASPPRSAHRSRPLSPTSIPCSFPNGAALSAVARQNDTALCGARSPWAGRRRLAAPRQLPSEHPRLRGKRENDMTGRGRAAERQRGGMPGPSARLSNGPRPPAAQVSAGGSARPQHNGGLNTTHPLPLLSAIAGRGDDGD